MEWEAIDGFKTYLMIASTKEPDKLIDEIKAEVKNINMNEFVTTQEKSEKTEVVQKDKLSELQQEIQTAKEENSFETLSTDTKNKAEKEKVSDNFAKTNVKAEETIQIKDDVKDIEFVASKVEKDISSKKIKKDEQIENVKIQVEEDVEITPVQQNNNAEISKSRILNHFTDKPDV